MRSNLYRGNSDMNPQVTRSNGKVTVAVNSTALGRRSYTVTERTGRLIDNSGERLTKADLYVVGVALDGSGLSGVRSKMRRFHAGDFD